MVDLDVTIYNGALVMNKAEREIHKLGVGPSSPDIGDLIHTEPLNDLTLDAYLIIQKELNT